MTTEPKHIPEQSRSLAGLQEAVVARDVPGGATRIGAGGYGRDALEGVALARQLVAPEAPHA
ncbi:MAG: hypothetical protein HY712_04270 [candidate division NC10 bacterium]|nr:hypothetical protein [candidate division NC10 bacterium]